MRRDDSGRRPRYIFAAGLLAWVASAVLAAPLDERLDAYLEQHELLGLRAHTLEKRLPGAALGERGKLLLDLAGTYEALLKVLPPAKQAAVRERCRVLLRENARPELDAIRVDLLKAEYLDAEAAAERARLKTTAESDAAATVATLKRLAAEFSEVAQQASVRVKQLEGQEQGRGDVSFADASELRAQLADARRVRSLARYYSGWSACYAAQLLGDRGYANEALLQFGALLNALERRTPTLDRLPKTLLVHEHVARAALGAATCFSVAGNDAEALRWLDEISTAEGVPKTVADQVLTRRIAVLARSSRWSELSRWVDRARAPQGKVAAPLEPADALQLAAVTLEGVDGPEKDAGETRLSLSRLALGDLITRGQTAAVVQLAKRFGTGVLASNGFVSQYVRALQAYDAARSKHGVASTEPTNVSEARIAYREAADLFVAATKADDASRFSKDVAGAGRSAALAWYYAGDFVRAADQFEALAKDAGQELRQSLAWSALVALDRAVEAGMSTVRDRRDELAAVFIASFPSTEQAAKLMLRRAGAGKLPDAQVVATLLAVGTDSPIRMEARRLAASTLFKMARAAKRAEADELIGQFLKVTDEIYPAVRDGAVAASGEKRAAMAERAVLMLRQQIEMALAMSSPDTGRASRAMQELRRVSELCDYSIESLAEELRYRALQVAIVEKDGVAIETLAEEFGETRTLFGEAAREIVLRHFIERARAAPTDERAAALVVKHGEGVVAALDAKQASGARANVFRDEVAGAAWVVFRASGDIGARDVAIRIDRAMYDRGGRYTASMRRLAELSEHAGDAALALECWTALAQGLSDATAAWFEASFNAIRLLQRGDVERARDAMKLLELSHPTLGPEPWAGKLRSLKLELFPGPAGQSSPAPADAGGGS
jgi:hypothetical protein